MASRSPEFLITDEIENEEDYSDSTERESLDIHRMNADLMMLLSGKDQDFGKIPFFYSHEGHA